MSFLGRILRGEDVLLVPQTKEHWDSQFAAGTWDRLAERQPNTIEIARLISEHAEKKGFVMHVLDVGCGNGGLARLIARDERIAYAGTDISSVAIASAREAVPEALFIEGDVSSLPPDSDRYDIIVFNEVLYYMDPKTALPRYRAYAGPDTQVVISIISSWRSFFLWRRIRRFVRVSKFFTVVGYDKNRWDIATGTFI